MSKLTSRLKILGASLALVAGCLCGCQLQTPQPDPTNASEVLERYLALEDKDNFHSDGTMDITMELLGMQMPIDATVSTDAAGALSHGTTTMQVNLLGQEQTVEAEAYTEEVDGTFYTYTCADVNGEENWTEITAETNPNLSAKLADTDLYKDAGFEATEDGYVVTMNGEQLLNLSNSVDLDKILDDLGQDITLTPKEDAEATLTFDKTCHLTAASVKAGYDIAYDAPGATDALGLGNISMSLTMGMDMTYGDYGKVDASTLAVPEEVKESAVAVEDTLDQVEEAAPAAEAA